MKHLVSIDELNREEIVDLVGRALSNPPFNERRESRNPGVGLIFLEPSTRTRLSFERACHQLSLDSVLLEAKGSSIEKDESLEDTLLNMRSMGINIFIIRSKTEGIFQNLKTIGNLSLINAGEGQLAHPTQALLDLATIVSLSGGFEEAMKKKLTILGDIKHSRVARSWTRLAQKTGMNLSFCAPEQALPINWGQEVKKYADKKEALDKSDIVMSLRVQKERHEANGSSDWKDFVKGYQISSNDLRDDQFLMHPGPVNWGVELHESIQNDKRSLILYQVKVGVHLRATIIDTLLNQ